LLDWGITIKPVLALTSIYMILFFTGIFHAMANSLLKGKFKIKV